MAGAFRLEHLQPFEPILFWTFSNFFTFILGSLFLLPQRANYGKGEFSQLSIYGWDWGVSVPGAFRLEHLQPLLSSYYSYWSYWLYPVRSGWITLALWRSQPSQFTPELSSANVAAEQKVQRNNLLTSEINFAKWSTNKVLNRQIDDATARAAAPSFVLLQARNKCRKT